MSLYYSDCSTDLLCCEDAGSLAGELPEFSHDLEFPVDTEDSIAGFVEEEGEYVPRFDFPARFQSRTLDASAREAAVAWIIKVHAFYRFQPLTAYLSVNYMDRYLSSHRLPQGRGWPLQLLTVACLSLAAKMEEAFVPSLLDLQVGGAKLIFEPKTICRMELLVLTALDWRLRSITPFNFISFFAYKVDPTRTLVGFLVSRASQIILTIISEINFLDYWPSSLAAAAILCAANEIPKLSLVNPEDAVTWCNRLSEDRIISCYQLMQDFVLDSNRRKPPRVLPQLRVTTRTGIGSGNSSSSSSFSSSSSSLSNKRRKLNNCLWVNDDKDRL